MPSAVSGSACCVGENDQRLPSVRRGWGGGGRGNDMRRSVASSPSQCLEAIRQTRQQPARLLLPADHRATRMKSDGVFASLPACLTRVLLLSLLLLLLLLYCSERCFAFSLSLSCPRHFLLVHMAGGAARRNEPRLAKHARASR